MANEEHLEILKQGVKVWNKWREDNRDITPDLKGTDLGGVVLTGVNFRRANLRGADFSGATFIYADVKNADLTDTKNLDFSSLSSARNHQEAMLSPDTAKEFKKYLKKR